MNEPSLFSGQSAISGLSPLIRRSRETGSLCNTDASGIPFKRDIVTAVWNKAAVIDNCDSRIWRKDGYGKLINYLDFSNLDSTFGWEILHIIPLSQGGTDDIGNLQPIQWHGNRSK